MTLSTQVQNVSDTITKYNVVVEVSGRKEEKVYTFNSETKKVDLFASVVVPAVIQPVLLVENVVNNVKTVISNNIEKLSITYPETATVFAVLKKENPTVTIDTIIVTPQSNSSSVTIVSPSPSGKEFVVNTYVYSE